MERQLKCPSCRTDLKMISVPKSGIKEQYRCTSQSCATRPLFTWTASGNILMMDKIMKLELIQDRAFITDPTVFIAGNCFPFGTEQRRKYVEQYKRDEDFVFTVGKYKRMLKLFNHTFGIKYRYVSNTDGDIVRRFPILSVMKHKGMRDDFKHYWWNLMISSIMEFHVTRSYMLSSQYNKFREFCWKNEKRQALWKWILLWYVAAFEYVAGCRPDIICETGTLKVTQFIDGNYVVTNKLINEPILDIKMVRGKWNVYKHGSKEAPIQFVFFDTIIDYILDIGKSIDAAIKTKQDKP